jgi:hypothetical protein
MSTAAGRRDEHSFEGSGAGGSLCLKCAAPAQPSTLLLHAASGTGLRDSLRSSSACLHLSASFAIPAPSHPPLNPAAVPLSPSHLVRCRPRVGGGHVQQVPSHGGPRAPHLAPRLRGGAWQGDGPRPRLRACTHHPPQARWQRARLLPRRRAVHRRQRCRAGRCGRRGRCRGQCTAGRGRRRWRCGAARRCRWRLP